MRTTLTLEDDVEVLLRKLCTERNQPLKAVVNEALRAGLAVLARQPSRRRSRYRTEPVSLGRPRLPDLDNIAEVLAISEGDDHP